MENKIITLIFVENKLKIMSESIITPTQIKKTFELLKILEGGDYVLIIDLAEELGIRQTELMEIILDNPSIFNWGKGYNTGRAVLKSVTI